jgi:DNA helicase-2/ATP-dependent DNA helicase PcrA
MSIKNHKDYLFEVERLKETLKYLENVVYTFSQNRVRFKEEIQEAYAHMDPTESSHSYQTIMMNSKLLDNLENNFEQLMRAGKKPYFARIDVKQKDKDKTEKLYIGKVSLFDTDMETPLVVDWRAPVASLYYDGRLGETAYKVEEDTIEADLQLKRQYMIENAILTDFVDVDISTSDTFLQAALGNHAGEKLKDIVSTIQGEQNAIIRSDINKPLIVQGVAGSGKTTIALHRIAYLIYTYAATFKPEHFMILAPNSLFLDYISQVLPELGADKVLQTTFVDFMFSLLGKRHKLTSNTHKLLTLIETNTTDVTASNNEVMIKAATFKNSLKMKEVIETFVKHKSSTFLPKDDLVLNHQVILSKKEIHLLFFDRYGYLPFYKRLEKIKAYMTKGLKEKLKPMLESTEAAYDQQIFKIRLREVESEERRMKLVSLIDARDEALKKIKKEAKTLISAYFKKIPKGDLYSSYAELICDSERLARYSQHSEPKTVYEWIATDAKRNLGCKEYELEDLAPLAYLQKFLFGYGENLDIHYVVIDEAQDFGVFQFFVLRDMLQTNRFTILGDLSQGIHMYRSIQEWSDIQTELFKEEAIYLTLEQSYRTTIEIMELANVVLRHSRHLRVPLAVPVVRHGDVPTVIIHKSQTQVIQAVEAQILAYKAQGLTTIAVISKTPHEAQRIYKKLAARHLFKVSLLDDQVKHLNNDIVVIPSHLAKGLEFDAVIIFTLDEVYRQDELDIKLLYVAMTRPLHRLAVHYIEGGIEYFEKSEKCSRPLA